MPEPKLNFMDKVVFVTGGGSGIGRGLALKMAQNGAAVAITDIDGDSAAAVAADITKMGGQSTSHFVDVTNPETIEAAVVDTVARFGHLDFVFANAGVLGPANLLETTPQDWASVLDVNIKGVVLTCETAIPHLMERRQGRIIITASVNGKRAAAHVIPYRVSKAAAIMYTRCLALMMAPYNITVNAICPGVTLTPIQFDYAQKTASKHDITTEAYLAERASRIPMQQLIDIEDSVALAEFLVSDQARFITGQAIGPDGGLMAA